MSENKWMNSLGWTEEHIEDLRYTGYSYVRQGKYDIALSFFEALRVLDPGNLYDLQTLGAIYIQLNEPKKAMPYIDEALKIDAKNSSVLVNLTKALFVLGKKEEALKIANLLKEEKDAAISNMAKALILAFE